MKKLIRFLLILSVLLVLFAVPVQAADSGLEQAIIESCWENESVNISQYRVTVEDLDKLFFQLAYSYRLPWYAQDTCEYTYDLDTGYVEEFFPQYLDEEEYDRVLYETRVQEILAETVFDGMSQWQQALSIHDYLVANCVYDESSLYYTGYDLLVRGSAVCEGYAEAYMDLLNRIGIPCVMVISEEMEHGWNLVQLEGQWYHVDVTWDDPVPNIQGQVMHTYFLLNDQEMADDHQALLAEDGEGGHYNWETDIICHSTAYSDTFWKDVDTQICYLDANCSIVRYLDELDAHFYLRDENSGELTYLVSDEEEYINIGQGQYFYPHGGLSLWNSQFYISSMDTVYAVTLDGSEITPVYSHAAETNGTYIAGSFVKNDTIFLTLMDHNGAISAQQVALPASGYHVHQYVSSTEPATCLLDGIEYTDCGCGIHLELPGEDALGHSYNTYVSEAPGLNKTGKLCYTCSRCGDRYYETLPALSFWDWLFGKIF